MNEIFYPRRSLSREKKEQGGEREREEAEGEEEEIKLSKMRWHVVYILRAYFIL